VSFYSSYVENNEFGREKPFVWKLKIEKLNNKFKTKQNV